MYWEWVGLVVTINQSLTILMKMLSLSCKWQNLMSEHEYPIEIIIVMMIMFDLTVMNIFRGNENIL